MQLDICVTIVAAIAALHCSNRRLQTGLPMKLVAIVLFLEASLLVALAAVGRFSRVV
jgi:hypothetical protein